MTKDIKRRKTTLEERIKIVEIIYQGFPAFLIKEDTHKYLQKFLGFRGERQYKSSKTLSRFTLPAFPFQPLQKQKSRVRNSSASYDALKRVLENRRSAEPVIVDGYGNFLFLNRDGKPKVAANYEAMFRGLVRACFKTQILCVKS